MKRIAARLVAALMVIAVFISLIPVNTFAWKNLTHVNSADLILLELQRSAAWNGGRAGIGVNLPYGSTNVYSYEIPAEYQEALFEYPDAFRAGSMGPDFYPDILTGQGYIHPYDADKKIGSGEWITLLCNSVNMLPKDSPERKKALAFTLGFMLHFCGDMFGHDFINMFAGGTYPLLSEVNYVDGTDQNLNIILSHMSEETYMDSLVNWDFYDQLGYLNIAAPVQFVADTLVFNGNVNNGPATIFGKYGSVPVQYEYLINLRMELFEKAEKWRPSIDPTYTTAVKFLDAWIKDLDDATYALVGCFDNMARRMVTEKNPSTTGIVTEELKAWVDSYGKYITPMPDIVIDGITFPKEILNMITSAIGLDEFVQDIEEWMLEQVESLALSALGFTGLDKVIDEYKDRMSKPQVQLDHEDNPFRQNTDNFAEFKIYMDRYALEQQMLSGVSMFDLIVGRDRGALDNALDSDLEAFYNTLVMFKLILMGPDNFKSFISKFAGVDQDAYQKNPANLVATTLELKMKTGNSGHGGTDDNIYALILRRKGNGFEVVKNKLLDISNYNDFEAGKTDTYLVELGQPVRLDEIEILIVQEDTDTAASAWNFAGVEITPYHAGIKLMDPIGFVGDSDMDNGKSVDLNFHEELMMRTRNIDKWTVNAVDISIAVKDNKYLTDDYGTDSDVYLDVYNGNSRVKAAILDEHGDDFVNGLTYEYHVPLGKSSVPLDKINLKLRLDGKDGLTMDSVKIKLSHGEIALTDWITVGTNKTIDNSTWDFSLQDKLSGHLKSFTPITLSFETNLDDGLLSYQKSLDDSGQWVSDASILWGNKKVRSEVFFRIFKGFEPEAEYKGKSEIGYGDAFDLEIVLSGVWNGVRQERRESIPNSAKMPPVNGGISVDFIDENGVSAGGFQEGITNGRIIKKAYKNSGLKPGVYGMTIRYNADRSNQQYADTFVTIPNVLKVTERTPVSHKVTFKVANGAWDDGKPDDIEVTVKGYEGDTLTLEGVTIPTAGQNPADNSYKAGKWDNEPKATTVIDKNTVFTYTYAKKAEILHKVTFKVANGSWDDGKPDDIEVTVKGNEGDTLTLADVTIPTAGQNPADNSYKAGSWDSEPNASTVINDDTVFTYTYAKKVEISHKVTFIVENGAWDDGKTDKIEVTVDGYEGDTLTLADVTIPTAGQNPADNSYKAGKWDSEPKATTVIDKNTVFTYTYAKKAEISHKVTFKVANGSWDDGKPDDIEVTVKGYEGDTLTLEGVTIPTAGQNPADNSYKPGSWDSEPKASTVIKDDTVFTYTYAKKAEISHKVTFKVANGSWDDGKPDDIEVTVKGYEGDTLTLEGVTIPTAGQNPADNSYKPGSWDSEPKASTVIKDDTVFTYTYAKKAEISHKVTFIVENGAWDDGKPDDIEVTVKGYEGDTLTLEGVTIPTAGQNPADNSYKPGSWDSEPKASTVINDDTVFTYTYSPKDRHTVTFKTGGGTAIPSVTVIDGEPVAVPQDPERKSYFFAGWFADEALKIPYDFSAGIFADTEIYAAWEEVTYTATGDLSFTDGVPRDLVITVKRSHADETCFSHFSGVSLDGRTLEDGKDYTAAPGSTVVTLKAGALRDLQSGDHTVTVMFDDGSAEVALTVKSAQMNPDTGDSSVIVFAVAVIAAGALLLSVRARRRKRTD